MACVEMKQSHQHWCLWAFISIAMNPVISSYDDQVFNNTSEQSEKKLCCEEIIVACSKSEQVEQDKKKHGNPAM